MPVESILVDKVVKTAGTMECRVLMNAIQMLLEAADIGEDAA